MKLFRIERIIDGDILRNSYIHFEDVGEAAKYTALLVRRNEHITKANLYECTDESMPKVRQVSVATFYSINF